MASISFRFALLCCMIVAIVWAERDFEICNLETESYGPVPPIISQNFEMKEEFLNLNANQLSFRQIYFDNDGQIGKYVLLANGTEEHGIVNYEVGQALSYYKIHPGAKEGRDPLSEVCVAKNIEDSSYKSIFGYRKSYKQLKSGRMFSANEALGYGGPYSFSYKGKKYLENRGFNATVFRGCVYNEDTGKTSLVTYYFSDINTTVSGGIPGKASTEITDFTHIDPVYAPLGAHVEGVTAKKIGEKEVKIDDFNYTTSTSWYKGEPEFSVNTFRLPDWLYCKGYRGAKQMPELPNGFSVRYETVSFTQDMEGKATTARINMVNQMFYDYDKKLARLDFTPLKEDSEIYPLFQSDEPVKAIFDFNAGIKYIIHKNTRRCFAKPISTRDIFYASNDTKYLKMGKPEDVLQMRIGGDFEYKGKSIERDALTDVWIGTYLMQPENLTFFKEVYTTADGWHEESDETLKFGVPVRLTSLANRMDGGELQQTITQINFFKFKPKTPDLILFDITGCIELIEHRFFGIIISVAAESRNTVVRLRWDVQQLSQSYIAEASGLGTSLRVQRVVLITKGDDFMIKFAILGKMKLETNQNFDQKGPTIQTAVDNLQKHIDSGKFSFKFTPPPHDEFQKPEDIYIFAKPGSLLKLDPTAKSMFLETTSVPDDEFGSFGADKKPDSKAKKGMPTGGLVALAVTMFILGIAIGVTMIYLYFKKYNRSNVPDQYVMANK